jgi:2-polyprenyl-6-methoxyphenol hydroxylase-like FAD-dependent oxidoreductase
LDVIVVGAGPTGLLLAAELALGGVGVEVVDRLAEPDVTVKGGSIRITTAEMLDRRGLAPAFRESHRRNAPEVRRPAGDAGPADARAAAAGQFAAGGHFAAIPFSAELVDLDDPELRAHTAVADVMRVPQRNLETILATHAARLGVPVRRGVEVTGLKQGDDGVTLETSEGPRRARWVVGADGGRSTVRGLAGIGFPGTDGELTGYQAFAAAEGDEELGRGWNWTPRGVYLYVPAPGRIVTVRLDGPPADRTSPVTAQEVQDSLRHVSGTKVTLTALNGTATRWTDSARLAAVFRRGRVLLAGDAAHIHSPFGGQGINLGIGDAANLGWKLAATIRGWAPGGLLGTYEPERRPVAAWVLDWTRAQVALMRGDEKTRQLREVVARHLLGTRAGMTEFVALTSGIGQRYTLDGSDPAATVEIAASEEAGVPGARVGRLLGDVALAGGGLLAGHAHDGAFVLLDRTSGGALGRVAAPWGAWVRVVADPGGEPGGLLIRPDGVVAWAGGDDAQGLEAALRRWAGEPA